MNKQQKTSLVNQSPQSLLYLAKKKSDKLGKLNNFLRKYAE